MTVRPTRRALLAGSIGTLLTACTAKSSRSHSPAATPAVDPDVALRAEAVARERALIDAYAAAATTPALATRLTALRAEHETHLQALDPAGSASTPSPSSTATPTTRVSVNRLAALERRAAVEHARAAVSASVTLAPVLASLAASEASHAVVL